MPAARSERRRQRGWEALVKKDHLPVIASGDSIPPGTNFKVHAFLRLEMSEDTKQVFR